MLYCLSGELATSQLRVPAITRTNSREGEILILQYKKITYLPDRGLYQSDAVLTSFKGYPLALTVHRNYG